MKNRFIVIAALAAVWLSGCGQWPRAPGGDRGDDPAKPQVTVSIKDGGRRTVAVQPDPLVFRAGQGPVTIVWSFPRGGNLRFARNGIVIDGEITNRGTTSIQSDRAVETQAINRDQTEIVNCRIEKDGLEFTCLNRHTRPGMYKYTVRVLEEGKPLAPLDPTVANG